MEKKKSNYEVFLGRYSGERKSSDYDIKLYPPKPSMPDDDQLTAESKMYFMFSREDNIDMDNGLEQLFGTI